MTQERENQSEKGLVHVPMEIPALGSEHSEVEDPEYRRQKREELVKAMGQTPPSSAMLGRFGVFLRALSSLLFAHVLFEKRSIDQLQDIATRGVVVYVMHTRSKLDYLYFNWAFLKHKLPLAWYAPGINLRWFSSFLRGIWGVLRRVKHREEAWLEAAVAGGRPAFLFLGRPKQKEEERLEYSQKHLFRLARAQMRGGLEQEVLFVPLLLLWERRPDPRHVSFLDDIFGTVQSPGFFLKAFHYVQTVWQSFFNLGQPMVQVSTEISLPRLVAEYPHAGSADISELLRERIEKALEREQLVILGPTGVSREELFRRIETRPEIQDEIMKQVKESGASQKKLKAKVRRYFEEIAAAQSLVTMKIFSLVLSVIWYRIYDGFEVDEAGLERVRQAGRESSLVLIPSHKSHIDYLIISYLFYHYGLMPPHIAAGVNLSFFPLGYFFRKAGAFFIRRSFKGESLYPMVFQEYLIQIMQQGYPIEFFIEGTRSRTGKLIKPRYGMMDMIIRAFASGRVEEVSIVPISVGYEKIIEEASYKKEVLGGEKKKESLAELLKAPKVLTSKYGRIHIQFGEPIKLGEYFERYEVERARPERGALEALTVRLAHRVIYDINHVAVVTPTALLATVLLNNGALHLSKERLLEDLWFLLEFLQQSEHDAALSQTLATSSKQGKLALVGALDEAVGLFKRDGLLKVVRDGEGEDEREFYTIDQEGRPQLAYYRNTIVHHVVPEALLATAMLSLGEREVAHKDLRDRTQLLSRLFKYEWIYEERAEFDNVFERTLAYLVRMGWLEAKGGRVALGEEPPTTLLYLRQMILTFVEAYVMAARHLADLGAEGRDREDWLKHVLKRGRRDFLDGEVLFFESLSKPTFLGALKVFEDWGFVERVPSEHKKETLLRMVGGAKEEVDRLIAQLEVMLVRGESLGGPRMAQAQDPTAIPPGMPEP